MYRKIQILQKASLVARTLRYLKPIQIWGQLRNRLPRKLPAQTDASIVSISSSKWQSGISKRLGYLGDSSFRFLNIESRLSFDGIWWEPQNGNLWNYNLNYFEWLNQGEQPISVEKATQLIDQWIESNPPGSSRAWDPYPVSLRIINWIRFFLENGAVESAHHSLAYQARWLSSRVEIHLLGNHYLVNSVALLFAGLYFSGKDADEWLREGWSIVSRELDTEVLDDGGHFERSPMYHSLILEDVLNLLNLSKTYQTRAPEGLVSLCESKSKSMLEWLRCMSYEDGKFPLFNDAAHGIASSLGDLDKYANRLSVRLSQPKLEPYSCNLKYSGFARMENSKALLFAEVGGMGPSYQPGHAHAGTFGFELSIGCKQILVDSGTNTYESSDARNYQRSTLAHNTLTVDGTNSSEVWSSFRVGRRASVRNVQFRTNSLDGEVFLSAEHDGYGSAIHSREWRLKEDRLEILDTIGCNELRELEIRFHFAPGVALSEKGGEAWSAKYFENEVTIRVAKGFNYRIEKYDYCPSFGVTIESLCLVAATSSQRCSAKHILIW